MLQQLLSSSQDADTEALQSLALKTAGLLPTDIDGVIADAAAKAVSRTVDLRAFCISGAQQASSAQQATGRYLLQDSSLYNAAYFCQSRHH